MDTHELTLVFANGETQTLTHEKRRLNEKNVDEEHSVTMGS